MAKRTQDAALSFRLPKALLKKLDVVAAKSSRTRANYLRFLIESAVKEGWRL